MTNSKSAKSLVRSYLARHRNAVILGHFLALPLGLLAALLGLIVGPASQVIMSERTRVFAWSELTSPNIAVWIERLTQSPTISWESLLTYLPAALVIVAGFKAICSLAQWAIWELTGEKVSRDLRADLVAGFLNLSPVARRSKLGQSLEADLAAGVGNDIRLLREYIVHFHGGLPREGLQLLFLLGVLLSLSPKLMAIFLLAIAPAGFLISKYGKKLRRRASKALSDYSALSEWLQQRLLGIETIKHYGTEQLEINKMQELNQTLLARFLRANWTKAQTSPMIEALGVLAMVLVLHTAFEEIKTGSATGSVLLSFFAALGWFSQSATRLGKYFNSNREASAAVARLASQIQFSARHRVQKVELVPEVAPELHVDGLVALDRVGFHYPREVAEPNDVANDFSRAAIANLSYTFATGQIYCICGKSGAGKSTLFSILTGLIRPSSGTLRAISKSDKNRFLMYLPQQVVLVPDSIAANVVWPNKLTGTAVEQEKILRALVKVGLGPLLESLPDGVMTNIGVGGQGVSGGQAQRIQLARLAFQDDVSFVLIDEGTSALDPETEQLVFKLIAEVSARGAGVIMIAHRLAAVDIADEVLILEHGQLVASGPPKIIKKSPIFHRLAGT